MISSCSVRERGWLARTFGLAAYMITFLILGARAALPPESGFAYPPRRLSGEPPVRGKEPSSACLRLRPNDLHAHSADTGHLVEVVHAVVRFR